MTIETSLLLTIISIVFSAGILYGKVNAVEKKVMDHDKWGERIAAVETDIKTLKEKSE